MCGLNIIPDGVGEGGGAHIYFDVMRDQVVVEIWVVWQGHLFCACTPGGVCRGSHLGRLVVPRERHLQEDGGTDITMSACGRGGGQPGQACNE